MGKSSTSRSIKNLWNSLYDNDACTFLDKVIEGRSAMKIKSSSSELKRVSSERTYTDSSNSDLDEAEDNDKRLRSSLRKFPPRELLEKLPKPKKIKRTDSDLTQHISNTTTYPPPKHRRNTKVGELLLYRASSISSDTSSSNSDLDEAEDEEKGILASLRKLPPLISSERLRDKRNFILPRPKNVKRVDSDSTQPISNITSPDTVKRNYSDLTQPVPNTTTYSPPKLRRNTEVRLTVPYTLPNSYQVTTHTDRHTARREEARREATRQARFQLLEAKSSASPSKSGCTLVSTVSIASEDDSNFLNVSVGDQATLLNKYHSLEYCSAQRNNRRLKKTILRPFMAQRGVSDSDDDCSELQVIQELPLNRKECSTSNTKRDLLLDGECDLQLYVEKETPKNKVDPLSKPGNENTPAFEFPLKAYIMGEENTPMLDVGEDEDSNSIFQQEQIWTERQRQIIIVVFTALAILLILTTATFLILFVIHKSGISPYKQYSNNIVESNIKDMKVNAISNPPTNLKETQSLIVQSLKSSVIDVLQSEMSLIMTKNDLEHFQSWKPNEIALDYLIKRLKKTEMQLTTSTMLQTFTLVTIYDSFNGTSWENQEGWLDLGEECFWHGVQCNDDDVVTGIVLEQNKLVGNIPNEIGFLINLQILNLHKNEITGSLPSTMHMLKHLNHLILDSNQLEGYLPTRFPPNLQILALQSNKLTGTISHNLFLELVFLHLLNLSNNKFEGELPLSMRSSLLNSLVSIDISSNNLIGVMPETICAKRPSPLLHLRADCAGPNPKLQCNCCSNCVVELT